MKRDKNPNQAKLLQYPDYLLLSLFLKFVKKSLFRYGFRCGKIKPVVESVGQSEYSSEFLEEV